ncbi:stem-specific protein TSJT1-like [Silene latifolia]|uniref:stem-specific protein TSJT1-like n=1 Tax=Silene latifolia TaxID=37657 RepID=UPI003D76BE7E
MLAIFSKTLVDAPKELNSPGSISFGSGNINNKPKLPEEIVRIFQQAYSQNTPLSIGLGNSAFLAYSPCKGPLLRHQRTFCGIDNMYCIFLGNLSNLNTLIKQYGLGKSTNDAMFVIEAYRTLRDRGPYPVDQVLKDLEGCFGFVIFDKNAGTVFAALGADQRVELFWGVAADGSVVISDNKDIIKASCAKSFAAFPSGCMYHSEMGLMSYEHPKNKLKAMPRIDSEGAVCGANFKVDVSSKKASMPRVGSEVNWAFPGSRA